MFSYSEVTREIEVRGAHPSKTAKGGAAEVGVIEGEDQQVGQPAEKGGAVRVVESVAMKQLPDISTSVTFWASVATLWAASGAWFTYLASALDSRQKTYDGILSLIEGLEAEFDLVSNWAAGDEGNQGYVSKTRGQLIKEHPDWFNPSRTVFTFGTPVLNDVTNSRYAKSLTPIIRALVMLSHSIRRLFDSMERYQAFVMGDVALYQGVLEKFAPMTSPIELASSTTPTTITVPHPSQIEWMPEEENTST